LNNKNNEDVILPPGKISLKYLLISKPLTIKGQPGTILEITEGPIIINIDDSSKKGTVKFSELNIVFNGFNIKKKQNNSYLFKLFPGTIVEIEDCDIEAKATEHNQKLVCIQVNSQKNKNYQNIPYTDLNQIGIIIPY